MTPTDGLPPAERRRAMTTLSIAICISVLATAIANIALPAIACFYMAATIGSAVDHHRGRGVVWKRRAYQGAGA